MLFIVVDTAARHAIIVATSSSRSNLLCYAHRQSAEHAIVDGNVYSGRLSVLPAKGGEMAELGTSGSRIVKIGLKSRVLPVLPSGKFDTVFSG